MLNTNYCLSLTRKQRRESWEINIGNIPMGGKNPIRLQSMTSTPTQNVRETLEQCIRIIKAGGDYVRITVPTLKDVDNLREIKKLLREQNISNPIIADIHFNPKVAEAAAAVADKIRINPGNYTDSKKFKQIQFSEEEYKGEIDKIKERFIPLLTICKKNQTALRIGVNHGSLSDRILSRYGDTPEGMTESAMEFLRICLEEKFKNVVVSLKASNTRILVQATRLLVTKMNTEHMYFPLHLGVTEAGEGEDGRIKSAVGIGALLADGLGDTIRVSLTEDPEAEIPVCKKLVRYFEEKTGHPEILPLYRHTLNPYVYNKRESRDMGFPGGTNPPVVVADLSASAITDPEHLAQIGWMHDKKLNRWEFSDQAADIIYVKNNIPFVLPEEKIMLLDFKNWMELKSKTENIFPVFSSQEFLEKQLPELRQYFIHSKLSDLSREFIKKVKKFSNIVLIAESQNINSLAEHRRFILKLMRHQCSSPVIFKRNYAENQIEDFQLKSAADFGGLFLDGLGDGIWLNNSGNILPENINATSFGILQASRVRTTKTEFISCPSCGRTLFDLQKTTAKIREKTSHLKGLKIGIMGCIVNGPGEMADADYGYVGAGPGKITLYKSREVIKRNIPEEHAVDELVELIKDNGDWIDPS
ncbi:MAG: (E)-4-hydroxy-3-methylbut-2-enyl-diphosphate synthase [Bacteroidales bacterium]|nr:(E)-4-hydroxy-3-methylbut-2-enyl-diphosphate synthase [Bacteroidales bacterium]